MGFNCCGCWFWGLQCVGCFVLVLGLQLYFLLCVVFVVITFVVLVLCFCFGLILFVISLNYGCLC